MFGDFFAHFWGVFYMGWRFYKDKDAWYQVKTAETTPEMFERQTRESLIERFLGNRVLADSDTWQVAADADDGCCTSGAFYSDMFYMFNWTYKAGVRWSINIPDFLSFFILGLPAPPRRRPEDFTRFLAVFLTDFLASFLTRRALRFIFFGFFIIHLQ